MRTIIYLVANIVSLVLVYVIHANLLMNKVLEKLTETHHNRNLPILRKIR